MEAKRTIELEAKRSVGFEAQCTNELIASDSALENSIRIEGGTPLAGTVRVAGSKNASLPIMAASILAAGSDEQQRIILRDVPDVADVRVLGQLLGRLGLEVERHDSGEIHIAAGQPLQTRAEISLARRLRASFCVLGPLLARCGRAVVPLPGGCRIGARPVNLHLRGLSALGAEISVRSDHVIAEATQLRGAEIDLTGPHGTSVTGTANVLCAAVLAEGRTILRGAACEPEVVDLCRFLIALGARMDGAGTSILEITGVEELRGAEPTGTVYQGTVYQGTVHRVIPDRIEAATWLLAACITGGDVMVDGAWPAHLDALLSLLHQADVPLEVWPDRVRVRECTAIRSADYHALPYPGLPTDVQPLWTALMTCATGQAHIRDAVFPDRFTHAAELRRMGALVRSQADGLVIDASPLLRGTVSTLRGAGPTLRGADVVATDLRGGAALVLAALAAHGSSTITGTSYLDRGYERWIEKLQSLGARIHTPTQPIHLQEGELYPSPSGRRWPQAGAVSTAPP